MSGGFEEHNRFGAAFIQVLDQSQFKGFIYSKCWFITDDDYRGVHIIFSLPSSFAFRAQLTLFLALTSYSNYRNDNAPFLQIQVPP